jgi:hypothetical protein
VVADQPRLARGGADVLRLRADDRALAGGALTRAGRLGLLGGLRLGVGLLARPALGRGLLLGGSLGLRLGLLGLLRARLGGLVDLLGGDGALDLGGRLGSLLLGGARLRARLLGRGHG